jgi:ribosomal protein L37E
MPDEEERALADDVPPRMVDCQRCSEEFDWQRDECPGCGWNKREWAESGRYGLSKSS